MFILISVVIPTDKRGDIVVKAVESVINSVELPEEIIVVEDRTCEARDTLSDYISEVKFQYHRKTMVYLVHLLQETLVSQKQVRHMFYFSMTMIHPFLINMKQEIFYWIEYIE